MIPNLHIQRWLSGFDINRLAQLGDAIRRKHGAEVRRFDGHEWEMMDTDPAVEP